jgi:hypothetical protein
LENTKLCPFPKGKFPLLFYKYTKVKTGRRWRSKSFLNQIGIWIRKKRLCAREEEHRETQKSNGTSEKCSKSNI